jgi:aconitate hydratase
MNTGRPVREVRIGTATCRHVDLQAAFGERLADLPYVLRILAENALRTNLAENPAEPFQTWLTNRNTEAEIGFLPARILMHDTTCTPALADIAAMRDQLAMDGVDPARLNPILRVDVSVDHSLSVDAWGVAGALARNMTAEITRNAERYRFMKWASAALDNVHVHPPGTGIMHTMNLEQLSTASASWAGASADWRLKACCSVFRSPCVCPKLLGCG